MYRVMTHYVCGPFIQGIYNKNYVPLQNNKQKLSHESNALVGICYLLSLCVSSYLNNNNLTAFPLTDIPSLRNVIAWWLLKLF